MDGEKEWSEGCWDGCRGGESLKREQVLVVIDSSSC